MIKTIYLLFFLLIVILIFNSQNQEDFNNVMTITSNSFEEMKPITQKHACIEKGGSDIIPQLYCKHPKNNEVSSYAIIIEDIDAPHERDENWTHWVVPYLAITYDSNRNVTNEFIIPSIPSFTNINGTIGDDQREIIQGINSWNIVGYKGMCSPKDILHKYKISVYALKNKINNCNNCTRINLLNRIQGNILYSGSTITTFTSNK